MLLISVECLYGRILFIYSFIIEFICLFGFVLYVCSLINQSDWPWADEGVSRDEAVS